ncbi:hypothetical protein L2E82_30200 [Cichorium intybus]|uniref:Uncharacterized protein n=1 Tax=Cichorium intybus TaxID=13427 RepID=A0ACB9CZQ7_CICIN|nr:hypothetical protein L2E82_30200 [Cichorium intybus]
MWTSSWDGGYVESKIQMYYEFGIFSTIYGGEYILNNTRFTLPGVQIFSYYRQWVTDEARYKEEQVCFRAFSPRKTDIVGGARELT